jgi:hypothetical protein
MSDICGNEQELVDPKVAQGARKCGYTSTPTVAIRQVYKVFENGREKYGLFSWRSSCEVDAKTYLSACRRHLDEWSESGVMMDRESNLPSLAHAASCLLILLDMELQGFDRGDL